MFFANQSYALLSMNEISDLIPKESELNKFNYKRYSKRLAKLEIQLIDDSTKEINVPENTIYLINFWATWCAPCRTEMPSLDTLQNQIGGPQFKIITIASGRNNVDQMKQFFSESEIKNLTLYRDPKGKVASSLGILGLPATILVGPMNIELARLIGSIDWASTDSVNFFEGLKRLVQERNITN